jgi:hypothetical protein
MAASTAAMAMKAVLVAGSADTQHAARWHNQLRKAVKAVTKSCDQSSPLIARPATMVVSCRSNHTGVMPLLRQKRSCTATGGLCVVPLISSCALTERKALQLLKLCCCALHGGHTLRLQEGRNILLTRLQEQNTTFVSDRSKHSTALH